MGMRSVIETALVGTRMPENHCPRQGSENKGIVGCRGEHTELNQNRTAVLPFRVHVDFSS